MTTDLKDKTVEELRDDAKWGFPGTAARAFDELARRLEEAQQKLDRYTRRSESGESLGDHYDTLDALEEAQKQIVAQQAHINELFDAVASGKNIFEVATIPLESLAAHDAETAAKALEELSRFFAELGGKISTEALCRLLDEKAVEYRAKAGRKE